MPFEIPFASFLVYSPRGQTYASRYSKQVVLAVKNDTFILTNEGTRRAIPYCVAKLKDEVPRSPALASCFAGQVVLVPTPRSAPLVAGGLWPTLNLCQAIVAAGVASRVLPLLSRITAVPRSATAGMGQRPGLQQHYDSLSADANQPLLTPGHHLVIVDDVITRGATLMACRTRLSEAFPQIPVSCFALSRTVSDGEVSAVIDAVQGVISFDNGHFHRHP